MSNVNNDTHQKQEGLFSGYVDFPLSDLMDVPLPVDSCHDEQVRKLVNAGVAAVGQLVTTTGKGAQQRTRPATSVKPELKYLSVPSVKLRNRMFLDENPLWQGTSSDLGKFFDQYTISAPTATLIAADEVLTACHAIVESAVERGEVHFVVGRHAGTAIAAPRTGRYRIRVSEVDREKEKKQCFKVKCVLRKPDAPHGPLSGNDWVILKLEESVPAATAVPIPLACNCASLYALDAGDSGEDEGWVALVLSHPLGLPLKYASATIEAGGGKGFRILSDVGSGSSGAPLLLIDPACQSTRKMVVAGVINGGDLGFGTKNFVQTATGLALDPRGGLDKEPQPVTPSSVISRKAC